jgi:hypothetical protein
VRFHPDGTTYRRETNMATKTSTHPCQISEQISIEMDIASKDAKKREWVLWDQKDTSKAFIANSDPSKSYATHMRYDNLASWMAASKDIVKAFDVIAKSVPKKQQLIASGDEIVVKKSDLNAVIAAGVEQGVKLALAKMKVKA